MNAHVLSTLTVAAPSNDAAPLFPAEDVVARLFLDARTHAAFLDRPVDDALLRRVYEAARMGPTAANSVPMRIVFVRSPDAKERLRPTLSPGNVDKTMKAPVTAIIAYDENFADKMPQLFPARAFLGGSQWKSILLVNLGYGDRSALQPRLPRLSFQEACRIE